jgi:hypothetical protein
MLRPSLRSLIGLVGIALIAVATRPWLLYEIGLAKIDGRPYHASQATAASEDVEALSRTLQMSQVTIERLSPCSYIWAIVAGDGRAFGQGVRVAWLIARSYNVDHLVDHSAWRLSGAALTIWLTRNWTRDELVAKAVELEKARR